VAAGLRHRDNLHLEPERRSDYLAVAFVSNLYRKLTAGASRECVFRNTRKRSGSFVPRGFEPVEFNPFLVSDEVVAVVAVKKVAGHTGPNGLLSRVVPPTGHATQPLLRGS